jgi:hypothetical protein
VEIEFVPKMVKRKDEIGSMVEVVQMVNMDCGGTSFSQRILLKLQKNLLDEKPPRTFVVRDNVHPTLFFL